VERSAVAAGDRFAEMAALAIALVLVAMLASARTRGWRVSAWSAGAAAVMLGLASIALPEVPGVVGQAWGTPVVAWALVVVAAAVWQSRQTDHRRSA
jgi:hypothetical protein